MKKLKQVKQITQFLLWTCSLVVLAACASSGGSTATTYTDPEYAGAGFKNILVIGVAGSYDNRAYFERHMASRIGTSGASGTAYYTVIGRNKEITRSDVSDAVRSRGFDAVFLTRVLSQESSVSVEQGASTAKVTRKDADSAIDLFRYDYEVLNNPDILSLETHVVLSTEVFSAADEKRIYAMQTTLSGHENAGLLIESAVDEIVGHLRKEGMIDQ